MRCELRDNGDLVLHWVNGDPAAKFQADGPFLAVATGTHPLDTIAGELPLDVVEAIRDWCNERIAERAPVVTVRERLP